MILSIGVAVFVGIWAAESIPFIPTTHSYRLSIVPTPIPYSVDYYGQAWVDQDHGGTLSGTFWAPNGTVTTFYAFIGSNSFESHNSNGSFHLSTSCNFCDGNFLVYTVSPATVYVNGTNSYLVPLI